jgi:uncharacterized protein (TIGR02145 family)
LYISKNGGSSWEGPLKNVKGDVGDKVSSGKKSIIFSVLDEYNELRGDRIKFQVRAESANDLKTIKIGSQDWTTTNLDITNYSNGDEIPQVQNDEEWPKLTTGAWCYYDNKTENGVKYGKLYNWYAVNDSRGLAPLGYHIPSDIEWATLINKLGAKSGKKLKSLSGWNNEGNGNNASGFGGLPGGIRHYHGSFNSIGNNGYWWSSTEVNSALALSRYLDDYFNILNSYSVNKANGYSVRCLKD